MMALAVFINYRIKNKAENTEEVMLCFILLLIRYRLV